MVDIRQVGENILGKRWGVLGKIARGIANPNAVQGVLLSVTVTSIMAQYQWLQVKEPAFIEITYTAIKKDVMSAHIFWYIANTDKEEDEEDFIAVDRLVVTITKRAWEKGGKKQFFLNTEIPKESL